MQPSLPGTCPRCPGVSSRPHRCRQSTGPTVQHEQQMVLELKPASAMGFH